MPKHTPNLNIQLPDPATDGSSTFNIETMINDPIETIDGALGLVPVTADVRAATAGNIALSGLQTVDGITLAAGDRVLVKNQTTGSQNGVYTAAAGVWARSADADTSAKVAAGIHVYVEEGTANGKTRWQMVNAGTVTVGTTALSFEKSGGPGAVTDAAIGSRTIADDSAPTGDSGTVTTLFGWLASMIKAITGGATWRTLPGMSIAAIKTILDAATNTATAGTLMKRDANGRAQVAAPAGAGDVARKDTVDGAIEAHVSEADPHPGYVQRNGDTMSGSLYFPDNTGIAFSNDNGITSTGSTIIIGGWSRSLWLASQSDDVTVTTPNGNGRVAIATVKNLTYYVRLDGNDNNNGLSDTASGAFKTIGKAISVIPQTVNHDVTIYVGEGLYDEDVAINGFMGKNASISLLGDSIVSTSRTIKSLGIYNCGVIVNVRGFNLLTTTSSHSVALARASFAQLSYMSIVQSATSKNGVYAIASVAYLTNSTISNKSVAVFADFGSRFTAINNSGTGNNTAFAAYTSSIINKSGTEPTAITPAVTTGGIVLPGNGIINPWGDNNWTSRTYIHAYANTDQALSATVLSKLLFPNKANDNLNQFNSSRFTATGPTGVYLIDLSLIVNSTTSPNNWFYAIMFVNGGVYKYLFNSSLSATGYHIIKNSAYIPLAAGDYVEIYVQSSTAATIASSAGNAYTNFDAQRIG